MSSQVRLLLVIGENHQEIAAKYSNTNGKMTKKVILARPEEAEIEYNNHLAWIQEVIAGATKDNDEDTLKHYNRLFELLKNTTPIEYFKEITDGSEVDEDGNVYTMSNPIGRYSNERCGQEALEKTGDYCGLAQPFPLMNGEESLITTKGDVDWGQIHLNEADIEDYTSAWETCVEGREPKDETETRIWNNMKNRVSYFANFSSKEEYINHCCSFWCYGVADKDGCIMMDDVCKEKGDDILWTSNFFDTYIKPLSDDAVIALYDIKVD